MDSIGHIELTSGQDLNASVHMSIIDIYLNLYRPLKVVVVSLPLSSGPRFLFRHDL